MKFKISSYHSSTLCLEATKLAVVQQKQSRVYVTYFYIIYPYIKRINPYCGLCVRNRTFGQQNAFEKQVVRVYLQCSKNSSCPFKCSVFVWNNRRMTVAVSNPEIRHKIGDKVSRPIRNPLRSALKQKLRSGVSAYRMFRGLLQNRSDKEKAGRNYSTSVKNQARSNHRLTFIS